MNKQGIYFLSKVEGGSQLLPSGEYIREIESNLEQPPCLPHVRGLEHSPTHSASCPILTRRADKKHLKPVGPLELKRRGEGRAISLLSKGSGPVQPGNLGYVLAQIETTKFFTIFKAIYLLYLHG